MLNVGSPETSRSFNRTLSVGPSGVTRVLAAAFWRRVLRLHRGLGRPVRQANLRVQRSVSHEHDAAGIVRKSAGGRQHLKNRRRPKNLHHHRMHHRPHHRNGLAQLFLDENADLRVGHEPIFNEQVLNLGFHLERRQSCDVNSPGNQRQGNVTCVADANFAGKLRHVEDVDANDVSRADGGLDGPRRFATAPVERSFRLFVSGFRPCPDNRPVGFPRAGGGETTDTSPLTSPRPHGLQKSFRF